MILARAGSVGWICGAIALAGAGCANSPPTEAVTPAPSPAPKVAPIDPARLIAANGIGPVRLGMTLAQAKRVMGANVRWENTPNFMVDFGAIAVKSGSTVLFYVVYEADRPLRDRDSISILMTQNPAYKTGEGVGPSTSIARVASIYGPATLSFNWDDEGREYVRFANQPSSMLFRTQGRPNDFDGRYPATQGDAFHSTTTYRPTAAISAVWVSAP
ncbi:MAG: hypothetical protein EA001_09065 [Oscillatoriales cyanobacterium]|nr:MAG: hypothetical protein EA001_09065 [Oscillatoriales cyanobacterium]